MRLGIVGVMGLVGKEILNSLDLLDVKIDEIYFFGTSTTGTSIRFREKQHLICALDIKFISELDYCILAVENDIAKSIIDYANINNSKCVIIDNSSEFRLHKNVPLIIPEINIDKIGDSKVIANPNCTTTMLAMLLHPLMKLAKIKKVVLSTYQAASGAGIKGFSELVTQMKEIASSKDITKDFWKKQYVCNVFSHNSAIDKTTQFNEEELKIVNETKKIFETDFKISPTCIRVPVLRSHSISVNVTFDRDIAEDEIYKALENVCGVSIENDIDKNEFPEPIKTSGKTDISVGRIRHDIDDKSSWNFFISGDQLLKGAAYNSVQILKYFECKNILKLDNIHNVS